MSQRAISRSGCPIDPTKQFLLVIAALAMAALAAPGAYAATCTPTGFYKDSMNLTAAAIDPPGTYSSTLDATGCNIGVFYGPGASGAVDNADISGANYFGVLVAGDCGGGTCTTGGDFRGCHEQQRPRHRREPV